MQKLSNVSVLLVGELRGTGIEAAKNICLAGPSQVVLLDPALCKMRDIGVNVSTMAQITTLLIAVWV